MSSIIRIENTRWFRGRDKSETVTTSYLLSLNTSTKEVQKIIHSHSAKEIKLHWSLNVAFGEDSNRKRVNNASQNFSLINKIVLNLAINEKTSKLGMKSKRKVEGWVENYLLKILGF